MAKYIRYCLPLLIIAVLITGCSEVQDGGSGGDLPDSDSTDGNNLKSGNRAEFLDQVFDFEMYASVNGLVERKVIDTLESDWIGTFSIDENYEMAGKGTLTYEADIFNVDEEECGYRWKENGTIEFEIKGKVHAEGVEYTFPVLIKSPLPPPSERYLSGAEATCSDPDAWRTDIPEVFISLNRDALFGAVLQNLHMTLGREIKMGHVLEKKIGTVNYGILVGPAALPLE